MKNVKKESATESPKANYCNGYSHKIIKEEFRQAQIQVYRDQNSEFNPLIVPNGEIRLTGLDDKILFPYAWRIISRDIARANQRKVLHHRRSFRSDPAALKDLYLALGNISKKWTMPIRH